jgi:hypothetical protein
MEFHQSQLNAPTNPDLIARATANNEENAMNHKRFALALLAVLGMVCAFSSPAHAGRWYFGINLELIAGPTGLQFDRDFSFTPLLIPGVQLGYDFGDEPEGFGARMSFNFFFIGQIALDGYYRFALDEGGSNAYLGAGIEVQFLLGFSDLRSAPGLHALGGLEWRPTRNLGLFIEATPGVLLQPAATARAGVHGDRARRQTGLQRLPDQSGSRRTRRWQSEIGRGVPLPGVLRAAK